MKKPLRVLIIEDSVEDTEMLAEELRRGGFQPTYERVSNPEELKKAFESKKWDAVISDYQLPGFGGHEAFKVFKEQGVDIPFILCSGSIGEESAVSAMKAGVHDFVMKGHISRLVPAIERELREAQLRAERNQADEFLRQSEEKYHSLIENIPDVAWRADRNGDIVFVSTNILKVCGYTPEEVYAGSFRSWFERVHPDDADQVREAYDALFKRKKRFDVEYRIKKKNGKWVWVHDRAVAKFERAGKLYADGVCTDITARKKAEEALKRKKEELEKSHQALQNLTYVFSQDIREPLRKIVAFGRRLKTFFTLHHGDPSEEAYLTRILNASDRIKKSTEGLLKYSKIIKRKKKRA